MVTMATGTDMGQPYKQRAVMGQLLYGNHGNGTDTKPLSCHVMFPAAMKW